MAAETLSTTRAASTFPIPENSFAGVLQVHWGSYAVAANLEDGDIFEMHYVPDGATVHDGLLVADDLDTGTEVLDGDVGWAANQTDAADPDGFGNMGVWLGDAVTGYKPEVGTRLPFGNALYAGPKTFTEGGGKTMIQVEFNVAANVFAAGDLTVQTFYSTK